MDGKVRLNRDIQTDYWEEGETLSFDRRFYLRKLSQEEYERQEREQRLSAADEKVVLAAEEVQTYR